MKSALVAFFLVCCMSGQAAAFNEDLSKVSFDVDNIPCGIGTLWGAKGNPAIPTIVDSRVYDLPVSSHIYAKNGIPPNQVTYNPLEYYVMLSYYSERFNDGNKLVLVAYAKSHFLGYSQVDITSNYNKIYSNLRQKLGLESEESDTKGKPDLKKSSMWITQRDDNKVGVKLRVMNIGDKKFATVESVCFNEYTKAASAK